jgi:PKD domain
MPRHGHDSPRQRPRPRRLRNLRLGVLGVLAGLVLLALGGVGAALAAGSTTPAAGSTTPAAGPLSQSSQTPGSSTTASSDTADQTVAPPVPEGPLVVTMTASPQVAAVGETVTYTADVSGVPPGKHVRYDWAFSGGTATGQQVSHSYPDPGDYPVAVTVTVVSVAGLSGVADQLTVVVSNTRPSKTPGSGSAGGQGSGSGTGSGHGSGSGAAKSAAARAAKRAKRAAASTGVANPLATQAPSPSGDQVEGFLLTDAGAPFAPPVAQAPTSSAGGSGGSAAALGGAGGAAGVGGAVALTIAIVTLGALDERRRLSLRHA